MNERGTSVTRSVGASTERFNSDTATWGKVDVMAPQSEGRRTVVQTMWGSEPDGRPVLRAGYPDETGEILTDGLQVYHNPHAQYPLDPAVFGHRGVVQNYFDERAGRWVEEELQRSLYFRFAMTVMGRDDLVNSAGGPETDAIAASQSLLPPPTTSEAPASFPST